MPLFLQLRSGMYYAVDFTYWYVSLRERHMTHVPWASLLGQARSERNEQCRFAELSAGRNLCMMAS